MRRRQNCWIEWMRQKKPWIVALLFVIVGALSLSVSPTLRGGRTAQPPGENAAGRSATVEDEGQSIEQEDTAMLSESQSLLLGKLYSALRSDDYTAAAELLIGQEEEFRTIYYDTFEGKARLFDGRELKAEIEGEGMALVKPGTVFLGSFLGGKPQGTALAFQAITLDAPRYDYSYGTWKDGRMSGEGAVGYRYYDGVQGDETKEVEKKGNFDEDLMNGDIVYSCTNMEDVTTTWRLKVVEGVTSTDDSWNYDETNDEYELLAENDDDHVLVMDGDGVAEVRWRNLVPWPGDSR